MMIRWLRQRRRIARIWRLEGTCWLRAAWWCRWEAAPGTLMADQRLRLLRHRWPRLRLCPFPFVSIARARWKMPHPRVFHTGAGSSWKKEKKEKTKPIPEKPTAKNPQQRSACAHQAASLSARSNHPRPCPAVVRTDQAAWSWACVSVARVPLLLLLLRLLHSPSQWTLPPSSTNSQQ